MLIRVRAIDPYLVSRSSQKNSLSLFFGQTFGLPRVTFAPSKVTKTSRAASTRAESRRTKLQAEAAQRAVHDLWILPRKIHSSEGGWGVGRHPIGCKKVFLESAANLPQLSYVTIGGGPEGPFWRRQKTFWKPVEWLTLPQGFRFLWPQRNS